MGPWKVGQTLVLFRCCQMSRISISLRISLMSLLQKLLVIARGVRMDMRNWAKLFRFKSPPELVTKLGLWWYVSKAPKHAHMQMDKKTDQWIWLPKMLARGCVSLQMHCGLRWLGCSAAVYREKRPWRRLQVPSMYKDHQRPMWSYVYPFLSTGRFCRIHCKMWNMWTKKHEEVSRKFPCIFEAVLRLFQVVSDQRMVSDKSIV